MRTNSIGYGVWMAVFLSLLLVGSAIAAADGARPPEPASTASIPLWPGTPPGSEGKTSDETVRVNESGDHIVSNIHRPSITPYLPAKDKATGAAVIVAPGGGHRELWMDHEGYNVGAWLSEHGVAAFILKYRLARENGSTYTVEGTELADIQRAIRVVRSRAAEWGVDPERIGVMGFSAGGEIAALAATRYQAGTSGSGNSGVDVIDRESSRPAFQALIYPAIPHGMNLSQQTPPAFLVCGEDDRADIAQGLPQLFVSLKQAGVSAELHVFAHTGHGFGLRASNHPPVSGWLELFVEWLAVEGMLKGK